MATSNDVLEAFAYYIDHGGYVEKRNGTEKYLTRAVENFHENEGSANWTWMGRLCGINPGEWCAMMVSTAVHDGCGFDKAAAKRAMWGVWPYAACNQLWEAAPAEKKHWSRWQLDHNGRTGSPYAPQAGDVIVFSDNGSTRTHTGMVYAADGSYVYTYEGNSANMARKRSYSLGSSYIYGYVTLNLDPGEGPGVYAFQRWLGVTADGIYGPVTKRAAVRAHQRFLNGTYGASLAEDGIWGPATYYATLPLRRGDDNDDVYVWQGMLYCAGLDPVMLDGSFGWHTVKATELFQSGVGLHDSGVADRYTWARMFGAGRPEHTVLRPGSAGPEVRYLQELLTNAGFPTSTDGVFGPATEASVRAFQASAGLIADGIVGPLTWEALE